MDVKAKVRESQRVLINHLAHFEASIAELYDEYGRSFPGRADFWQSLSQEERTHARFLNSLHTLLDKGDLFYNLDTFDVQTVNARLAEVETELAVVRGEPISFSHALETALSIEKSIMDGHFYDVAKSYAPEFAIIADHLSKDTKIHLVRIQDLYRAHQSMSPQEQG